MGYKVNSERAVQFRKWATRVVEEFTIKGFAMDDERLKRGGSVLSDRYFEEQLQRVREIRLPERKFYQKITDIYATSIDYDLTAQATKRFFASVQNKLHSRHRSVQPRGWPAVVSTSRCAERPRPSLSKYSSRDQRPLTSPRQASTVWSRATTRSRTR